MLSALLMFAAAAAWEPAPAELPRDPVRKLVPAGARLLVLLPRQLYVVEGERQRRAFALTLQTDALVDAGAGADGWWLLSRRTLWRSDDLGFSWRVAAALPPRDKNELLALGLDGGRRVVATRHGLRHADGLGPAGHWGSTPIAAALSDRGRLLLATARGLAVLPGGSLALTGDPVPSAFVHTGDAVWLAAGRRLYRCGAGCAGAGMLDATSLAAHDGAYWAAATDGVHRYSADGAAVSDASEGLAGSRSGALASDGVRLWFASEGRLYAWAAPVTAALAVANAAAPGAPVPAPPMERVRRWIVEAQALAPANLAAWRSRARWRAAAPAVGVSLRRGLDDKTGTVVGNSISLSATESRVLVGPDGTTRTRSSGGDLDFGVSLTWQLDELVFNPAELTVSNELEDQFRLRESVLLDATRLYYDRLRAERQMLAERDALRRGELALRVDELTAELDFYTGGRFSAALRGAAP